MDSDSVMTLTAAQINDIAVAIGMTPTLLNAHLLSLGATLTVDKETKVLANLSDYNTGAAAGIVWFTPTESNEGFNMSPVSHGGNADPRTDIRILLEIPYEYWPNTAGYGSIPICL